MLCDLSLHSAGVILVNNNNYVDGVLYYCYYYLNYYENYDLQLHINGNIIYDAFINNLLSKLNVISKLYMIIF